MDSFAFLLMLIWVFWLALWSARDHDRPSARWWPFDMRDTDPTPAPEDDTLPPWRRRSVRAPARPGERR